MNRFIKSAASVVFAILTLTLFSCEDESNVIGLDDAVKYGYIKVTLTGTDPNENPYTVTKNFRFAPSSAPENSSSVYTYDDDGYYQEFEVLRYQGPFNEAEGYDNSADLFIRHEEETADFDEAELEIETIITTEDNGFFSFSEDVEFNAEDVTSYNYNPSTGKLTLKFETEVETYWGMVTVTADINVTVFENLTPYQD